MGFSEYNYINARYYGEIDGEDLTWQGAASMLNRAERLIRLIRSMAFGPAKASHDPDLPAGPDPLCSAAGEPALEGRDLRADWTGQVLLPAVQLDHLCQ